ncbi:hypothetical protein V6N13_021180 [Hibiscus sabdariffa]|uniref:Uncharacterized protein n=2 Tax=Hibiscus sabdariffa TaxID=183260 RepID=A0ABR2EVP0_9ROSI
MFDTLLQRKEERNQRKYCNKEDSSPASDIRFTPHKGRLLKEALDSTAQHSASCGKAASRVYNLLLSFLYSSLQSNKFKLYVI